MTPEKAQSNNTLPGGVGKTLTLSLNDDVLNLWIPTQLIDLDRLILKS